MEEIEETTSVHHVTRDMRTTAHYSTVYMLFIASVAFLGVLAYALYLVHQWLVYLGYMVLGAVGLLIVVMVAVPVVLLLRAAFTPKYHGVEQHGGYFSTLFGRIVAAPPLASAESKASSSAGNKKTTKVELLPPAVPSLFDLLTSGDIAQGKLEMVMGYDSRALAKGVLEIVAGPWPGTHAVAGKGRSGKTRRVIAEVCQALIAGAKITICDPHPTKPDSLARTLAPLEPWLYTVARGEREIVEATQEFFNEMEARVSGTSEEGLDEVNYIPRLIVYDEWAREMTTDLLSEDERDLLIKTATGCSSEYAGYNGFCCLISQRWTQDTCGGTDIRRCLQVVFCHNISAEFAAFFFRPKKWQNRAEELKRRECLYKDYEGQVREIITLTIPDDTAVRVSEYLMQIAAPPERPQLPPASEQYQGPGQTSRPGRTTDPLTPLPEQIAYIPQIPERVQQSGNGSPVHGSLSSEQLYELKNMIVRELGESVNGLHKRGELGENGTVQGETFTMSQDAQTEPTYTHEQETAILNAAFQLARESNGRLTRSDIMERLGWNKKQWPIIKAVCDKHGIAKQ